MRPNNPNLLFVLATKLVGHGDLAEKHGGPEVDDHVYGVQSVGAEFGVGHDAHSIQDDEAHGSTDGIVEHGAEGGRVVQGTVEVYDRQIVAHS